MEEVELIISGSEEGVLGNTVSHCSKHGLIYIN